MTSVYLVVSRSQALGYEETGAEARVMACFVDPDAAARFSASLMEDTVVAERTVFIGQPPRLGYNQ